MNVVFDSHVPLQREDGVWLKTSVLLKWPDFVKARQLSTAHTYVRGINTSCKLINLIYTIASETEQALLIHYSELQLLLNEAVC